MIKATRPGRDGSIRVTFALPADEPAGAVSVVGSFNDWNPFAHPLRRRANRTRSAAVTVQAGTTLHFRYLAEGGVWFASAAELAWNVEPPAAATIVGRLTVAVAGARSGVPANWLCLLSIERENIW